MVVNIINYILLEVEIVVIGCYWEKLEFFFFVKECYIIDNIFEDLVFDYVFECCGGDGIGLVINDLVCYICF